MSETIRIVQCGLGPIGLGVTREIASRRGLRIVGAVDVDPALRGRRLGEVAWPEGDAPPELADVAIGADAAGVLAACEADVALITTASSLAVFAKHAQPFIEAGLHVVSSCEELAYPHRTDPERAAALDRVAKKRGVAVLGTGINPGFLMDFLPLALTAPLRRIDHILVERSQDASRRRLPFQKKVGAGLSPEAFAAKVVDGSLRHVGLTESMDMIADALGWTLTRSEDVIQPVLAERAHPGNGIAVKPGHARGVEQIGCAWVGDREVLRLVFRAFVDNEESRERVTISGDPPLTMEIPGGIGGDVGTCAILVNAVFGVVRAAPGLRTMLDSAPVTCR